jgi:hypothetical protein
MEMRYYFRNDEGGIEQLASVFDSVDYSPQGWDTPEEMRKWISPCYRKNLIIVLGVFPIRQSHEPRPEGQGMGDNDKREV